MSNPITYDDTSSNIVYAGKWATAGSEEEFDHTTHGTKQAGAMASFTFTGTSVSVYGTIGNHTSAVVASTYSVDGSAPVAFNGYPDATIQYSQLFFQATGLAQIDHELIITAISSGTSYWLDYLVVGSDSVPSNSSAAPSTKESTDESYWTSTSILALPSSPAASPTSSITSYENQGLSGSVTATAMTTSVPTSSVSSTIIDDTDSTIVYGGSWFAANNAKQYDGTAHGTQDNGATATLRFTGTEIAVFGTIPSFSLSAAPQTSTYQIDDGTPISVTLSPTSNTLYQQLFFQSPSLQDGKHVLVVTFVSGGYTFSLDYFAINSTSSGSNISTSSLPSSSVSTGVHSVSTLPNSQTSSSTSSGSHAGAIAGGVFATLFFISLLVAIFLWHRKRRARRAPSRLAPKTPDPSWLSVQTWHNEKAAGSGPRYEPVV